MVSCDLGRQAWIALTSKQAVPYGVAAAISLGIALLGGAAALGRRVHNARGRAEAEEASSPTGAPIRRRPRVSLSDMASVHLTSVDSDAQTRHPKRADNAQA